MHARISPEQALIYSMVVASAVDRSMADVELRHIGDTVRGLPAFRRFDDDELIREAQACGQLASGPDGLNAVLGAISAALPAHLRETAYMLACEVIVSDHAIRPEEARFLELLAGRLSIDRMTAAALERGATARHRQL